MNNIKTIQRVMDFNITGSKTWGTKDEFLDTLHNQLFEKSELKYKSEEGDQKRNKKRKKKKHQSSETQLCNSNIQKSASIETVSLDSCNLSGLKKQKLCNVKDSIVKSSESLLLDISTKCKKNRENRGKRVENPKPVSEFKKVNKRNKFKSPEKGNVIKSTFGDPSILNSDINCKNANLIENVKKKKLKKIQSEGCDDSKQSNYNLSDTKTGNINLVIKHSSTCQNSSPANPTKKAKKKKSRRKGKKRNLDADHDDNPTEIEVSTEAPGHKRLKINPAKLQHILEKHDALTQKLKQKCDSVEEKLSPMSKSGLLKEKMTKSFQAAKFRLLNEKLYTVRGDEAFHYFSNNASIFEDYHQGYRCQVDKWPINPVDIIIEDLRKSSKSLIIADLGCGDAKIAKAFPQRKVHSFDLVALNDFVTPCNISKVPLSNDSVDVTVFCLSLMGVNLNDYIQEARRILKIGGLLKIAEVESRIESLSTFIHDIEKFGFSLDRKDVKHKMFTFLDFNKVKKKLRTGKLPVIQLNPCTYKKR